MAGTNFSLNDDIEKLIKLRKLIAEYKASLEGMDRRVNPKAFNDLEKGLKSAQSEFDVLSRRIVSSGTQVEKNFKRKIEESSVAVNRLSGKIIDQNAVVQNAQNEVNRLSKEYEKLSKNNPGKKDALINLEAAENNLAEQKNNLFDLQQQQDRTKLSTTELNQEYNKYSDSVKNAAGGTGLLSELGSKFKGHVIAAAISFITEKFSQLIAVTKEFVNESIKVSTKGESITAAFNGLNRPELLDGLRSATQGAMSDLELMQATVKAESFSIPLNDLGNLLQYAQVRAQQTGESVDSLVDSILDGIGNQSADSLDTLQIKQSEYDESVKKTGSHTESAIDLINKKLEEQCELTLTAADKEAIANAKRQNAQMKVGNALLGVKVIWEQVSARFFEVIGNLAEKYLPALVSRMEVVINKFIDWYNNSLVVRSAVASLYLMFATAFAYIKRDIKIAIDAMGAFAEVMSNISSPGKALAAYKNFLSKVSQNAAQASKEVAEAIVEATEVANQKLEPVKLEYVIGSNKIMPKIVNPDETDANKNKNGGKTPPKDNKEQEEIDRLLKLANEKKKAEIEAANKILENEQKLLNIEEDSFQKKQNQTKLNHKKELLAIRKRAQELIEQQQAAERQKWESEGKQGLHYSKINTEEDLKNNYPEVYKEIEGSEIAVQEVKNHDLSKNFNEILSKYKDFQTKRIEMEKKYSDDLKALEKERNKEGTDTEKIDRAITDLKKKKQTESSSLSLEEFQDNVDWAKTFADLEKLSTDALKNVRDKLKEYLKSSGNELADKDIKAITDAIKQMDAALVKRTPVNELVNAYEEYKQSTEEVIKAKEKLAKLEKDTPEYTQAQKELTNAQDKRKNSLSQMNKAINGMGSAGSSIVNSGKEIVGILESFGIKAGENVTKTLDGIGQMMGGLAKIDITKPFSFVTGSISVLAGLGKTIGGIFGGKSSELTQEEFKYYDNLTATLKELINTQKDALKSLAGNEAKKAYEAVIEDTQRVGASAQDMGRKWLNSGASKGVFGIGSKKSHGKKLYEDLKKYQSQFDGLNLGISFSDLGGRADGLFSMSAKQLTDLKRELPEFWATLDDNTRNYLNTVIEAGEEEKKLTLQLNETLTGISFDSLRDSFKSFLTDADSDASKMAENFEEYMRNAIAKIIIDGKMKQKLEEWYQKFAKAMGDEDGLTKTEAENLEKEYNNIMTESKNEYDTAMSIAGISNPSSSAQEASKGVYQGMSQDTGDRLEARNTAIHMTTVGMDQTLLTISGGVQNINAQMIRVGELTEQSMLHMEELRNIQLSSLYELKDINNNTKQLHQMNERLGEMNDKLNRL